MEQEKKILVVDDDLAILDMLDEVLSYYGYNVSTLSRAGEVFERDRSISTRFNIDGYYAGWNGWARYLPCYKIG
jgi:DNA-binding NtrC family response regulator